MPRPHLLIGPLGLAAAVSGALALVADPGPIDDSAVPMIALGVVLVAVTAMAGLLLARAPWGRWTLAAAVVVAMAIASFGASPLTWVTYALGAAALVGLLGPWTRLWIRHHRLADAPGPVAVALLAVAPTAPLFVGFAVARSGADAIHWALAGVASVGSVLYGRGNRIGIWMLRTAVPVVAVPAALAGDPLGGLAIAAGAATVTVLAWLPAARRTTTVIAPVLPEPVSRDR